MSRTRAERRFNTHVKTSARKALAIRVELDQLPAHGYCGGKISRNGEACSCSLCITCNSIEKEYKEAFRATQLSEFMKSFEE